MRRRRLFLCCSLVALGNLVTTPTASADSITTGTFTVSGALIVGQGGFGSVSVFAPGFVAAALCAGCLPGTTSSFSGMFAQADTVLSLESPQFVFPEPPLSGPLSIVMPFSFSAFRTSGGSFVSTGGSGTVTGLFGFNPDDFSGYTFLSAAYVAGALPLPTPEPGSLLLIATGMTGIWLRCRRHR